MNSSALKVISVFGQFMAVFPFVVLCEGLGFGQYIWWHYLALYFGYLLFYLCGRLCAGWALSPKRSRYFRPKAIFLSKSAIVIPLAAYIAVCATFELSSALYIYALPAALIMYHGGYSTSGREYSDIFGRGWFALFFIAAVITAILLWFTHNDDLTAVGNFQLCLSFGILIIIAAVLTNQTNIDICTHQRDSGKAVLPKGLRAYNGGLVAGVIALIVGACLFVVPLARGIMFVIKQILSFILTLIQGRRPEPSDDIVFDEGGNSGIPIDINDNSIANFVGILIVAALVVLIIVFRRQIWDFIKSLAAPLFRVNEESSELAYVDEVTQLSNLSKSGRSRRKVQQLMYKRFVKENDPIEKYRVGYNLMLLYLMDTPFSPVAADNTDIHRVKGEQGLRSDKVRSVVSVYNDVRYKGRVPTKTEIEFEESFIEEIRR